MQISVHKDGVAVLVHLVDIDDLRGFPGWSPHARGVPASPPPWCGKGVPAAVAMQFPISHDAAIECAEALYAALAAGYPVDAAVSEARKAIYTMPNDIEWATPVLVTR